MPSSYLGRLLDGRYRIVQKLGQGGFSETYLAEDTRVMNRQVVVKHLKPSSNHPDLLREAKQLFAQEAEVLANLGRKHPQIPDMLAYFEENQEFYLVQEYVRGHTLGEEIANVEKFTEAEAIKVLREVLMVLKFVHENQVIHRDIKPSNLMRRSEDGKIVLIDFGAVKQLSAMVVNTEGQPSVTRIVGSPGYMAVEQQSGRPRFSSDIYALGITMIQALTGRRLEEIGIDNETNELDWKKGVKVNPKLAAILDKMVRFNFADRYQTAGQVLYDLDRALPSSSDKAGGWKEIFKPGYLLAIPAILLMLLGSLLAQKFWMPAEKTTDFLQQGDRLIELQKYEEAQTVYDRVLEKDPNSLAAWNGRGKALSQLQRYDSAIASFDKAISIDPRSFTAWLNKAEVLNASQRYSEAARSFEKALELDSKSFAALDGYGFALLSQDKYEEALKVYETALKEKPNEAQTWSKQGMALWKLQRYSPALASFNQSLQIDANNGEAWLGKGLSLNELKRYREAIESFDKAISLRSHLGPTWFAKGEALQALGQNEAALSALVESTNNDPDRAEPWNLRGELLLKLNRDREALSAFKEALRLKPDFQKAKENEAIARQRLQ